MSYLLCFFLVDIYEEQTFMTFKVVFFFRILTDTFLHAFTTKAMIFSEKVETRTSFQTNHWPSSDSVLLLEDSRAEQELWMVSGPPPGTFALSITRFARHCLRRLPPDSTPATTVAATRGLVFPFSQTVED